MQVAELPDEDVVLRERLLSSLSASPPSRDSWELGGSTNFMIAAARLGLKVCSCGHLAADEYGDYMSAGMQARPPLPACARLTAES